VFHTRRLSKPSLRWNHIPHEALLLEINSRIMHRESFEANAEVIREHFRERLKFLDPEDHKHYINQVAIDLKRELRICRDVYVEYLRTANNKSITAKGRVALDFAVAPMASRRLREETIVYVRHVGVSDLMFAVLFCRLADRLVTHRNFVPQWLELENVVSGLIPDTCFQQLKGATSREIGALATGPFGNPVQPFDELVINLRRGGGSEWKQNAIWDDRNILLCYELWQLWNFVFREICDQHAAIDCNERSNVARALIAKTASPCLMDDR
jgi:hypothetical protein